MNVTNVSEHARYERTGGRRAPSTERWCATTATSLTWCATCRTLPHSPLRHRRRRRPHLARGRAWHIECSGSAATPMRRTFFTTAFLMASVVALAVSVGTARYALADDGEAPPPVTPFIDSGNDLPDLDARAREARAQQVRGREAWPRKWYGWQIVARRSRDGRLLRRPPAGHLHRALRRLGPRHPPCARPHGAFRRQPRAAVWVARVGGAIGYLLADCPPKHDRGLEDFCGLGNVALGTLVGMGIAAGIDAAIAFTRLDPNASPEPRARPTPVRDRAAAVVRPRRLQPGCGRAVLTALSSRRCSARIALVALFALACSHQGGAASPARLAAAAAAGTRSTRRGRGPTGRRVRVVPGDTRTASAGTASDAHARMRNVCLEALPAKLSSPLGQADEPWAPSSSTARPTRR